MKWTPSSRMPAMRRRVEPLPCQPFRKRSLGAMTLTTTPSIGERGVGVSKDPLPRGTGSWGLVQHPLPRGRRITAPQRTALGGIAHPPPRGTDSDPPPRGRGLVAPLRGDVRLEGTVHPPPRGTLLGRILGETFVKRAKQVP